MLPRPLKLIIVFSLFLHLAGFSFVLANKGIDPLLYGDAKGYISLAQHLRDGLGFVSEGEHGLIPEVFRSPGLPLLLYPFVGGTNYLVVYFILLTSIASVLLPYLIWWIGVRLFNDRAALIAAGITAFEPMLIFFSWQALTEIPFLIFGLLALASLIRAFEKQSFLFAMLAGFCAGYAVLIRPGNLMLFACAGAILLFIELRDRKRFLIMATTALLLVVTLFPWYYRTHALTGVWTLSGAGWRNVYTDYLSSVRSLKNGTSPAVERDAIMTGSELGLLPEDLNNPKYSSLLREQAISELTKNIPTILKLEPLLLFSYFTNDGYYYQASRLGFMPRLSSHISPTRLLLDKKLSAIPEIWHQLAGQWFVPVLGRLVTVGVCVFALLGLVRPRYRIALLFGIVIALGAVSSTILGFGVEARLRIQVMPLLFLLAGFGFDWVITLWRDKMRRV